MAQQTIDVGTAPNSGDGDHLRDAFIKINDNFDEIYGGAVIHDATAESSPDMADELGIYSIANGALRKVTRAALLAIGTAVQAYNATLAAIAGLSQTGLVARTGAGSAAARTITETANEITVTNGDGVSGNPTLSLPNALTFTGKTITGGTFSGITLSGTTTLPGSGSISSGGNIALGSGNRVDLSAGRVAIDGITDANNHGVRLGASGSSYLHITSQSGDAWQLNQFNGSAWSTKLTVAAGGAATFASTASAPAFIPTGSSAPANGMYLPSSNHLGLAANSNRQVDIWESSSTPVLDLIRGGSTIAGRMTASNTQFSFETVENKNLNFQASGNSTVNFTVNGGVAAAFSQGGSTPTAYVSVNGNHGGNDPGIYASSGSLSDVGLRLVSKGTSPVKVWTNGGTEQAHFTHTAGADRFHQFTGANAGNPKWSSSGGHLEIDPAGSNTVILTGIPTSSAGLPTGGVWSNSGVLTLA